MRHLPALDEQRDPCNKGVVTDTSPVFEQERATLFALWRGIGFVIVPGLIFAVGVIALLIPARPPISILNGCYRLNALPLIKVSSGLISVSDSGIAPIHMSVETGRDGYTIKATTGFSFQTDQRGAIHAIRDYPLGKLIPAFVRRDTPPSLGLDIGGEQVKIPKIGCPKG